MEKKLNNEFAWNFVFRCNRFQIKLQIQKPLIVNFKIRNSEKFQSIVSFFLGREVAEALNISYMHMMRVADRRR